MADLRLPAGEVAATSPGTGLPSRYRHPGDVIWLVAAVLLLLVVLGAVVVAAEVLLGRRASLVRGVEPDTAAGGLLVGWSS